MLQQQIKFECDSCGTELTAPAERAGEQIECSCGATNTVPVDSVPAAENEPEPENVDEDEDTKANSQWADEPLTLRDDDAVDEPETPTPEDLGVEAARSDGTSQEEAPEEGDQLGGGGPTREERTGGGEDSGPAARAGEAARGLGKKGLRLSGKVAGELFDDVVHRRDLDVLVGIIALVLGLLFLIVGATKYPVCNVLLLIGLPAALGFIGRAVWLTGPARRRIKLLIIGGLAFLFLLSPFWNMARNASQRARAEAVAEGVEQDE
jgi:hypothetical protein